LKTYKILSEKSLIIIMLHSVISRKTLDFIEHLTKHSWTIRPVATQPLTTRLMDSSPYDISSHRKLAAWTTCSMDNSPQDILPHGHSTPRTFHTRSFRPIIELNKNCTGKLVVHYFVNRFHQFTLLFCNTNVIFVSNLSEHQKF
jgi:hypothetical protein